MSPASSSGRRTSRDDAVAQEVRSVITTLGSSLHRRRGCRSAREQASRGVARRRRRPRLVERRRARPGRRASAARAGLARAARVSARRCPWGLGSCACAPSAEPVEDVALGNPGRSPARATPAPPSSAADVPLESCGSHRGPPRGRQGGGPRVDGLDHTGARAYLVERRQLPSRSSRWAPAGGGGGGGRRPVRAGVGCGAGANVAGWFCSMYFHTKERRWRRRRRRST